MKLSYQVVIIAFVFSLLGGIGYGLHHHGYESGQFAKQQEWQLKWVKRDANDLTALAAKQLAERTEEQRRQNDINQVTAHAQNEIDKARLDAANAQHAADSLQLSIRKLRTQLAASETSKLSSTASTGPSGYAYADMLAGMLSESDKAAGEYAAEADNARIAGLACERSYDAITGINQ